MNIPAAVFSIIVLAVVGVALGVTLGITDMIQNSLNGTLAIPAEVQSSLDKLGSLGGAAITIGAAMVILALVFSIVTWLRSQSGF